MFLIIVSGYDLQLQRFYKAIYSLAYVAISALPIRLGAVTCHPANLNSVAGLADNFYRDGILKVILDDHFSRKWYSGLALDLNNQKKTRLKI